MVDLLTNGILGMLYIPVYFSNDDIDYGLCQPNGYSYQRSALLGWLSTDRQGCQVHDDAKKNEQPEQTEK